MAELPDLEIAATLRAHGLRVTPQRRAIWCVFAGEGAVHLAADEVLRRARLLPEVARGTVYNTLTEFVSAGLLTTVYSDGPQLYDPNLAPHEHFRCTTCGEFYDVHSAGLDRLSLREPGFAVDRAQILFEGTCPGCAVAP